MRESVIEAYLVRCVKALGGEAYKYKSPNRANVPDRIVLLPGGRIHFVECKAPDEPCTAGQLREHNRLRVLGFDVKVIDSKEQVGKFIDICC